MTPVKQKQPGPRREREGAAMLITMLVLLMATAAGMFGVHSSSFEIRAAGAQRQMMQTQVVGEVGLVSAMTLVDMQTPDLFEMAYENSPAPAMVAPEPSLTPGTRAYRIYLEDMTSGFGRPPLEQSSIGLTSAYRPFLAVEVTDKYDIHRPIPGQASHGNGRLRYLGWTFTSRGRLQTRSTDVTLGGDTRAYHEAASDGRAYVISGPVPRRGS